MTATVRGADLSIDLGATAIGPAKFKSKVRVVEGGRAGQGGEA
jgi:hypothetical protein